MQDNQSGKSGKSKQSSYLHYLHKYPNLDMILFVTLEKLLGVARTSVILLSLDWRHGHTLCRSIGLDVNIGLSNISSSYLIGGYWTSSSLLLIDACCITLDARKSGNICVQFRL